MHYNRSVKEPVMTTSEAQRQRVYELCDLAKKIVAGPGDAIELRAYEPQEIADALRKLISDEIAVEREACARLADNFQAGAFFPQGEMVQITEVVKNAAREIAANIRARPYRCKPPPLFRSRGSRVRSGTWLQPGSVHFAGIGIPAGGSTLQSSAGSVWFSASSSTACHGSDR